MLCKMRHSMQPVPNRGMKNANLRESVKTNYGPPFMLLN